MVYMKISDLLINQFRLHNKSSGFSIVLYLFWTHRAFVTKGQSILSKIFGNLIRWWSVHLCVLLCSLQIKDTPRYVFFCVLISSSSLCSFSSPLNEDVFTLPRALEESALTPDIAQLSEQIHRLLVQPVHSSSSQGYGSLASNGSHELQPSAASSSESNGTTLEDPAQLHKPVSTHIHTQRVAQLHSLYQFSILNIPNTIYSDLNPKWA